MDKKIVVKPDWKTKIDDVGDYIDKINRGVGSPKPKKGKGSFKRKPKHKNKDFY